MKFNNFLLGLAVPSIFGFLIYCIIAIRFDFFGLGILSTLLASILILSILLNFGISPKVTRVCANSDGDYIKISKEISNSFLITFSLTLISYLIVKSFSSNILEYLLVKDDIILKVCLVSSLTAINKSVTSTYIGLNKDKNFFTGVVLRSLVALLYVLLFNNDIYTLLLNSLLFGELFYFLYWVLTKNSIKIKFSSIDRLLITEQLKFGIKQLPTSLSDEATYRVDILIIAYFKGAILVGIYSIISLGLEVLREIARATFISRSSNINESKNYFSVEETLRTKNTLIRVSVILIILGILGSSIGIDLLQSFTNLKIDRLVRDYLLIFSIVTAFLSSNTFLKELLPHLNLPGKNSLISIMSFILNILLNILLIPQFEILGALLASSISILLSLILRINLLRKNLN